MADVAPARHGDSRDGERRDGDVSRPSNPDVSRADWRSGDTTGDRDETATGRDEDRAQLILITGLTLAVIFVTVVLLLNTVIYTENLATRGVDAGGGEAVEFRDGAVDDLGAIMDREHRTESSVDGVIADFEASAAAYANATTDLRARDGVVADITVVGIEPGHFIAQEEDGGGYDELTAGDGTTADWTVAGNATRARDYRVTVAPDSLSASSGDAFTIVAEGAPGGSNATWSVSLWSASDPDDINVTVTNETASVTETFAPAADGNHTVDVTGGTVNGEPFDALVWAEGVQNDDGTADYDIRYENGDEATGTYHLVVQSDDLDSGDDDQYGSSPADRSSQPYVVDAVYSADVEISHRTPELEYGDVIRVAPGERDA
ncbi:hypothetical protein C461_05002 [Halorubrum aidingense JCM 13560]|uniref:Uncharacterized protein n=1 Tax=Halorubrum aidingense JCM 13560 TaxID=1230454 RepID=M0PFW9_9EURY|nr:hypothetical protein [Halorubrum aidingense]EMA68961.1 hypothetical protein C461_05002 [Halorubrum aidingense JCM 13560]